MKNTKSYKPNSEKKRRTITKKKKSSNNRINRDKWRRNRGNSVMSTKKKRERRKYKGKIEIEIFSGLTCNKQIGRF